MTPLDWLLAIIGALGIGVAKSGFSGVSMLHVLIFANLFGARESTGVVLPMLIVGDLLAVHSFRQHARWDYIRRLLPPATLGVIAGALLVRWLGEMQYKPLIGAIILALTTLQLLRLARPSLFEHAPHARGFAWAMGLLVGVTTMLANAAGPIAALYLVAVALPKLEFAGTSAWLFLIINCFKVPFSVGLGLIHRDTLLLNAALLPAIVAGLFAGRWLVDRIPQRTFDALLLVFAAAAALRLIGFF
ncbi:MAG: sulfite exporter TauE/SafE family protein [Chthoniobacter sp.]|nr:sulfite exporter TauE/SafE family protein [Chthoniobacter sp.]